MYEEFFGLQRRPFSATPEATCFVPLESHQGALDALAVSSERGQGIGVLTGDAGLGKSLVGLRLAFELQPTFATVFLGHSAYATRRALLQAILFELNRPYERLSEQELRLELASALKSLRSESQGFVLIVDEAHRLSAPLLDEVRLLALLADRGEPLVRVVLIGNRELEERLADPSLSAFNQRVCCQVDLTSLTQVESLEYLSSKLEFAGGEAEEIFTEEALTFLAKASDGVPRCLNHLADHSLLLAFVTERRPVNAEVVREALNDLKQLPLQWNDPISGGEIYRGLSQRPAMEDSAVDLWPPDAVQHEELTQPDSSWTEPGFGESGSAIEIGGELDETSDEPLAAEPVAAEQFTCLKQDWQANVRRTSTEEEMLADVTELAQSIDEESESRLLGQTFGANELEFGAPSPQSFAVEEFATENESDESDPDREFRDESAAEQWSAATDEVASPVWNLPQHSWSASNDSDSDFEEEPVVDRYVRIETGDRSHRTRESLRAPHNQSAKSRTVTAVKTTRLVLAAAGASEESHESPPLEPENSTDLDSGIVESYSRQPRNAEPVAHVTRSESTRDWHLPTELLQATFLDDGIEEQIGTEVLDMYLDVQQSLIDRELQSGRTRSRPAESQSQDLPQTADEFAPQAPTAQPDAIQRAYGRLFSELRRRKQ